MSYDILWRTIIILVLFNNRAEKSVYETTPFYDSRKGERVGNNK